MKKMKKVATIISIIIFILGIIIIIGSVMYFEIIASTINNGKIYIDGTNFTGIISFFNGFSADILSGIPVLLSIIIIGIIWLIYGVIYLIIKRMERW